MRFGKNPKDPNNVRRCGRCRGKGVVITRGKSAPCPSCLARQTLRNYAYDTDPKTRKWN